MSDANPVLRQRIFKREIFRSYWLPQDFELTLYPTTITHLFPETAEQVLGWILMMSSQSQCQCLSL